MTATHRQGLVYAQAALAGLATGDAFGEQFFGPPGAVRARLRRRALPPAPWRYTDDTAMALALVEHLKRAGTVEPERLATAFAARHRAEPARGYGRGMHEYFERLAAGASWHEAAGAAFAGQGSMGNGAAMRVAPLGAWFHEDLDRVATEARRSAAVTHAHAEAQAGAIAVALAAAGVARGAQDPEALFATVLERLPPGATRDGVVQAARLESTADVAVAADVLGTGARTLSQDTVPYCLWCAAHHLGDFEAALWTTVAGLGDRDTTCAIVGGIVAADPAVTPPAAWLAAREALPG